MNETNRSKFKKRALSLAVASCLSFAPWVAEAAGLGKLTVLSGLGQPLRAELDLGATREELSGMSARLASQDAFRQAGIDYASVLYDLRLSVETKANGQGVVKLTSGKPVNDPFLDFLIELNWPAGRLVREYTFLLDPPEIAIKQPSRPVAEAKIVETVQGGGALPERPTRAVTRPVTPTKTSVEPKKSDAADSHVVQPGETLRKIATETKYDGVSLEQMLVGLFQKNPDAFMGNNINRLKSGAILGLPDKAAVEAVSEAQAKKVYLTQAGDWNAYRQKLAATTAKAPAKEAAASQASSGKITAKVQEKAAPVEQSKDQVKVSRTEMAAAGASAGKAEAEVDRVARERALKEAQERLAQLEKNVGELQKLVDMKNQKLAEMQQQSAAKKEEAKPVEPVKPIEPAKPVEIAKPVEPPKVEEAPKAPEELKPVVAEKPVEVPKPVEPQPLPPKKVAPPPPPPEPEPGFVETLLSDPLPLAGGGGILALLVGYLFYKRRRSSNASMETTAAPGATSLARDSVFRATGGQSVDTGNTPPQTGDFSQTGPGTIDTDEVDPVAEADVYMAYGRDAQAEEILLEALQKDPQRTAIHAKLLEIYAARRSLKQFETLASELYSQTGGAGSVWEKVAHLGAGLDPNNPLYSASQASPAVSAPAFDADATMVVSLDKTRDLVQPNAAEATPTPEAFASLEMPAMESFADETLPPPELGAQTLGAEPVEPDASRFSEGEMSLDFDLASPTLAAEALPEPTPVPVAEALAASEASADSSALDFDLGALAASPAVEPLVESALPEDMGSEAIDFDLSIPTDSAGLAELSETAVPEFSPEGTLVTRQGMDLAGSSGMANDLAVDDFSMDLPAPEELLSTELDLVSPAEKAAFAAPAKEVPGASAAASMNFEPSFDLDQPEAINAAPVVESVDDESLSFEVNLTDSVVMGQPMMPPDFDIGAINLDLSAEPSVSVLPEEFSPAGAEDLRVHESSPAAPTVATEPERTEQWEEVNTKLDLAKAYEEMGDLEGARELLLEVVSEGTVDLVEQARTILGRIGE